MSCIISLVAHQRPGQSPLCAAARRKVRLGCDPPIWSSKFSRAVIRGSKLKPWSANPGKCRRNHIENLLLSPHLFSHSIAHFPHHPAVSLFIGTHSVSVKKIQLVPAELERSDQHVAVDPTTDLHDHIRKALHRLYDLGKDIQALSHRLHSAKLEYMGFVPAARSFCRELSEQRDVRIEFKHANITAEVPKEISLCLFRVLQEALQNAIKH